MNLGIPFKEDRFVMVFVGVIPFLIPQKPREGYLF